MKPKHPMEVIEQQETKEIFETEEEYIEALTESVRHYFSDENMPHSDICLTDDQALKRHLEKKRASEP